MTLSVFAQTPEKMSYQAVIRNSSNELLTNQAVNMRISILQGSTSGTAVYVETQTPTTNTNGLVSLEIGSGTVVNGDFTTIAWVNGPYFIKTETDPSGGTNYSITGTSQLLSVPYALHAKTAETISGGITETDPTVIKYNVGDYAQGGVVFWVDETGQHGLVAHIEDSPDTGIGIRWFQGVYGYTQVTGSGLYSGKINTPMIITAYVALGGDGDDNAAKICNRLVVTHGNAAYGDWYLPSYEEAILMHNNKAIIEATSIANGGSGFYNNYYWTSTEYNFYNAYSIGFGNGGIMSDGDKQYPCRVRAIRAF
jgi:hypothetical protein